MGRFRGVFKHPARLQRGMGGEQSQAKETITALVIKFQNNLADYHRASYNETLTRIDFINPFFEALGWDMTNRRGLPENLREVIHEDRLDIKGRKKAPDYSFRLPNGRVERKFFLEAKKPAVNLAADLSPAYQVRLYGWNAGLPLSALTDFEELAVYDCRVRPYPQDKTTVARIAYFTCLEYADALTKFTICSAKRRCRPAAWINLLSKRVSSAA